MADKDELKFTVEDVTGDDVSHWRVINSMSFGRLVAFNDDGTPDDDGWMLMIHLETVDTDGRNPADVRFGVNPGALESAVGSAGATLLESNDKAEAVMLYQLWNSALKALNARGQEHDPDCPHHHGDGS